MRTTLTVLLLVCIVGAAANAVAQPAANEKAQDETAALWQATTAMPVVCVVQLNPQAKEPALTLQLPIPTLRMVEKTYIVQLPVVGADGTVTLVPETRKQVVRELAFAMQRHDLPLADVTLCDLKGVEIAREALAEKLKQPIHVLYEHIPDAYARSVLRDDLLVLKAAEGASLPALVASQQPEKPKPKRARQAEK